ncbi:hypothetical protein B0H67DRAFT_602687 [Lasiosphaeris hirsuta]|uniref:DUF1264-domain-containing protein n=1 Tax=Lasiosphaeris hirsuta TaxID=260670 RepID=A0AA40A111_9PEZI|nr:hypothetical protein B0H67DRAFT_602687 [Lasiosphaeris hirsuta]
MEAASHTKDHCAAPKVAGEPRSTKSTVLETGAALIQDFSPVKNICAHLNAFHVYASDPRRMVETNHYCGHLTEDVRQCLLYDSPSLGARLIGIEYMITPKLYGTLDAAERRLWHSHVFEVKSGMLVIPQPSPLAPQAAWEKAETAEMEEVIRLYSKIPLGEPQLMTSITAADQLPGIEKRLDDRDSRFPGTDWRRKKEIRDYIPEPTIHPDADATWKT